MADQKRFVQDNTNHTLRSFASSRSGNSYYSETDDPYHYDDNENGNIIDIKHHRKRRESNLSAIPNSNENQDSSFNNHMAFNYFNDGDIINASSYTSTQSNMDIIFQNESDFVVHSDSDSQLNVRLGNIDVRHRRRNTSNTFQRPPTTYGSIHSYPLSTTSSNDSNHPSSTASSLFDQAESVLGPSSGEYVFGNEEDEDDNLLPHGHYNTNQGRHSNGSMNDLGNFRRRSSTNSHYELKDLSKLGRDDLFRLFKFNSKHKQTQKTSLQRLYISEEDLVLGIQGLSTTLLKTVMFYILSVLSLGILPVLCHWFPKLRIVFQYNKSELFCSNKVLIETELGDLDIIPVSKEWYGNKKINTVFAYPDEKYSGYSLKVLSYFNYRFFRLYYDPLEDMFKTNKDWYDKENWTDYDLVQEGVFTEEGTIDDRIKLFGHNSCQLEVKSIMELIFQEALHPFFVFQIFSMILWAYDDYIYYALCILIISVLSVAQTVFETRQSSLKLQSLAHTESSARVFRNEFWMSIPSTEIIPGDIIDISDPNLKNIPCDCLLLSGQVLVNESMLSGESIPINKTSCNSSFLLKSFFDKSLSKESKYKLYNGTEIIKTKATESNPQVTALCLTTGFNTVKGSLIRSIVFPSTSNKDNGKDMTKQAYKYIFYMTLLALLGFMISAVNFKRLHLPTKLIIVRALDIVTIVVPPGLPATLSVAVTFSISRLKNKCKVFCIKPTKINSAGGVSCWVFDKTGTLTGEGLVVKGIIENSESIVNIEKDNYEGAVISSINDLSMKMLQYCLACCHGNTLVRDPNNGNTEIIGDPLDVEMFNFTNSKMSETAHDDGFLINNKYNVFKVFEFDSHLRRMGVLMEHVSKKNTFFSLVKGSPESILNLCNPHTIPHNYDSIVKHYAHQGYRLIALAGNTINLSSGHDAEDTREYCEQNLMFLGFIIFENKIKPQSRPVIMELKNAGIPSIMCTGDNILTAISVSKEASILRNEEYCFVPIFNEDQEKLQWECVDNPDIKLDSDSLQPLDQDVVEKGFSLAVTGDAFNEIFGDHVKLSTDNEEEIEETHDAHFIKYSNHYKSVVLMKGKVYARMSPDDKEDLVNNLQDLDFNVGFCGDGANDVGALRSADCGVSLSEAEASVAAPFTSQIFDISCVLNIMKEGRCSIVTSFSCFQYMSLYSAIQFITVTVLYSQGSNLGDLQYLFIDLLLIIPLAITMSWSAPNYGPLVSKRPSMNLVSSKILVPIVINVFLILLGQMIPWYISKFMKWYVKPVVGGQEDINSTDNTVLFLVSSFQYIFMSVVLTQGPPYRESIFDNHAYISNVFACIVATLALMFGKYNNMFGCWMQLTELSFAFKTFILSWCILEFFGHEWLPKMFNKRFKKKVSSKRYKRILQREKYMSV
ncbi:putative acid anhydride hydrolase [Hanseniaspora uvarum]|nr:putative acid anhydride hydrolase [Hanseniaspora uvarum]